MDQIEGHNFISHIYITAELESSLIIHDFCQENELLLYSKIIYSKQSLLDFANFYTIIIWLCKFSCKTVIYSVYSCMHKHLFIFSMIIATRFSLEFSNDNDYLTTLKQYIFKDYFHKHSHCLGFEKWSNQLNKDMKNSFQVVSWVYLIN